MNKNNNLTITKSEFNNSSSEYSGGNLSFLKIKLGLIDANDFNNIIITNS